MWCLKCVWISLNLIPSKIEYSLSYIVDRFCSNLVITYKTNDDYICCHSISVTQSSSSFLYIFDADMAVYIAL